MNNFFSKTNSWHWLGFALVISAAASFFIWRHALQKIEREHAPVAQRQQTHLEELRMLTEEQADSLNKQIEAAKARLERFRADIAASGAQPIPEGTDSLLDVKNAIDSALAAQRLRVTRSDIRVPAPAATARPGAAAPAAANASAPQAPTRSYAEAVDSIRDRRLREMVLAEERRRGMTALRENPAPQAAASAGAAPARGAARASASAAAASASASAASAALPFRTQDVSYVVEGDYKNMFLFLVGQSFLKPSYHFKDIALAQVAPDGGMRMNFTAQVNYQEKK